MCLFLLNAMDMRHIVDAKVDSWKIQHFLDFFTWFYSFFISRYLLVWPLIFAGRFDLWCDVHTNEYALFHSGIILYLMGWSFQSLMSRFNVQGFPTILVFGADKDSPIPYEGARTASAIESFALEQLDTNVAPPEVTELTGPVSS